METQESERVDKKCFATWGKEKAMSFLIGKTSGEDDALKYVSDYYGRLYGKFIGKCPI